MAVAYRVRADQQYWTTVIQRFWRQQPMALRPAVQFTVPPIVLLAGCWLLAPSRGVGPVFLMTALVLALILGPGAYVLTRSLLFQRFKESAPSGSETVYRLSDEGISINGPLVRADVKWPVYPRAVRFPDGILLVRRRVIAWLPDSALVDSSTSEATALVERYTQLRHIR